MFDRVRWAREKRLLPRPPAMARVPPPDVPGCGGLRTALAAPGLLPIVHRLDGSPLAPAPVVLRPRASRRLCLCLRVLRKNPKRTETCHVPDPSQQTRTASRAERASLGPYEYFPPGSTHWHAGSTLQRADPLRGPLLSFRGDWIQSPTPCSFITAFSLNTENSRSLSCLQNNL